MIHAELRKESYADSGSEGYYTLRYLVWNGSLVGTYGVHYSPKGPYGASRDYHEPATEAQIKAHEHQQHYWGLSDAEQDAYDKEHGFPAAQSVSLEGCCYLPDGPSICDGSSLVEIIDGDDQRCYEIAASMAGVDKETV